MNKENLEQMYCTNKMSTRAIAISLGTNQTAIVKLLKEFGISARTYKENKMPVKKGEKIPWDLKNHTVESDLKRSNALKGKFNPHKSENYHPSVAVTCHTCGKVFKKKYAYWKASPTKIFYCGQPCNRSLISKGTQPWNYGKTNPLIDFNCPECGKLFQVRQLSDERKLPEKIYCSPKCAFTHLNEGVVFRSRSHYKYSPYYGPEWVHIKKIVLSEEVGCSVCSSQSDGDVDHIKAFDSFDNHVLANDRSNLWRLCDRCHGVKTRYEDRVGIQERQWWIDFLLKTIKE